MPNTPNRQAIVWLAAVRQAHDRFAASPRR